MSFLLSVYILPNSSKNEIVGEHNGMVKIKIKSQPNNGKANKELIVFLAEYLSLKKSQITIAKGHTARQKMVLFDVDGLWQNNKGSIIQTLLFT